MSSDINEYSHLINTLEAYPRVNSLFKRDFIDFNRRLKTVIRRHEVTKNSNLEKELDDLESLLQRPIKVIVVGKYDLELTEIVQSTEPLSRTTEQVGVHDADKGLTYIVCNTKIDDVATGLQEVSAVIKHCLISKTLPVANNIYLVCQTDEAFTHNGIGEIRREALKQMKDLPDQKNLSDHLIIGHQGQSICKQIGHTLESKIIRAFDNVRNYLIKFIKLKRSMSLKIQRDLYGVVSRAIEHVLLSYSMIDDCSALKKLECILLRMPFVTKSMSEWYRLPPDICNLVFQNEWNRTFSESSQRHVCDNGIKIKLSLACDYVKQDVETFTKDLDRRLILVGEIALTMRKMIFEIDAYIRTSNLSSEYQKNSLPIVVLPVGLQKDLCAIDERIRVVTYLDVLDINIDSTSEMENVKCKIEACLTKYSFEGAYRINFTKNKLYHSTIHCGNGIWVKNGKVGTLGLFVRGSMFPHIDNFYALTTSHIFDPCATSVFTKTEDGTDCLLGKIDRNTTVKLDSGCPFVDIAAIQVDKSYVDFVDPRALDEEGHRKLPEIVSECKADLLGRKVYKYGAGSKFTVGMISSNNFTLKIDGMVIDELIAISTLGGDFEYYATNGDSGSVNFLCKFENEKCVKAVSMNIGVDIDTDGNDHQCLSFILKDGLQALTLRSGVEFSCDFQSMK